MNKILAKKDYKVWLNKFFIVVGFNYIALREFIKIYLKITAMLEVEIILISILEKTK